ARVIAVVVIDGILRRPAARRIDRDLPGVVVVERPGIRSHYASPICCSRAARGASPLVMRRNSSWICAYTSLFPRGAASWAAPGDARGEEPVLVTGAALAALWLAPSFTGSQWNGPPWSESRCTSTGPTPSPMSMTSPLMRFALGYICEMASHAASRLPYWLSACSTSYFGSCLFGSFHLS